jgi:hypothetical protein
MRIRRSARIHSLILAGITVIPLLLSSCQAVDSTQVRPQAEVKQEQPTVTIQPTSRPPVPTLPPTWTPTPEKPKQQAVKPLATATPTATFNVPQTVAAQATTMNAIQCKKYADAWEIRVEPGWRAHWCAVRSKGGVFYEFQMLYPEGWSVETFGELSPNLYFNTNQKNIDLRLYQIFRYGFKYYTGTLEDAPVKAAICGENEKCTLVIDPNEKILKKGIEAIGGKEVMIVDSQEGTRNIRRYFFFVPFRFTRPKTNRLFFFKLYTPEQITDDTYIDLQQQIEDMIVSVKPDL